MSPANRSSASPGNERPPGTCRSKRGMNACRVRVQSSSVRNTEATFPVVTAISASGGHRCRIAVDPGDPSGGIFRLAISGDSPVGSTATTVQPLSASRAARRQAPNDLVQRLRSNDRTRLPDGGPAGRAGHDGHRSSRCRMLALAVAPVLLGVHSEAGRRRRGRRTPRPTRQHLQRQPRPSRFA